MLGSGWIFYAWCTRPARPDSGIFTTEQFNHPVNIATVVDPPPQANYNTTPSPTLQRGYSHDLPPTQHIYPAASGSRGVGTNIQGTYGHVHGDPYYEPLDPSFYVRSSSFFCKGRVFAIILNENAGSTTDYNTSNSFNVVRFEGNMVYTSVRRFIVVRAKREFCFAVPIFTYSNKATTKRGVHPEEHAVVYSWGRSPRLLEGETGITKAPIPVVMTDATETLSRSSRIYFGIHHPIQYNVKVKDIGYVPPDYIPTLIGNWMEEDGGQSQQDADVTASG